MILLVGFKRELDPQTQLVHRAAKAVMAEKKVKLNYMVGTMIEVPRGAPAADEIAQTAEFFSFGRNDLTQSRLGMSRDDSGSFLPAYAELEIVKKTSWWTANHLPRLTRRARVGVTGSGGQERGIHSAAAPLAQNLRNEFRVPSAFDLHFQSHPARVN